MIDELVHRHLRSSGTLADPDQKGEIELLIYYSGGRIFSLAFENRALKQLQCCYFCESSCLFYLSFNFDFYVSKKMHL